MIVLNSLFPVFFIIVLGIILKRFNVTNTSFLQTSDKLVYHIFFPLMLFWKIGNSSYGTGGEWQLCLAVLVTLVFMFALSLIVIATTKVSAYQAGSFAQSCYRFNTYIGVAIVLSTFGQEGIRYFGLLIALAIPCINVAAVTTLIWFSQEHLPQARRFKLMGKALLSNPLIIGCLAGLLYSYVADGFPLFIDNSLELTSLVTLPLALLSIGGSLTFSGMRKNLVLSLMAAGIKLLVFPLLGYISLRIFDVTGVPFAVGMIFFSLPTSTAIYVLSSQLNSDPELASSAIVVSTLISFPILAITLLLYAVPPYG